MSNKIDRFSLWVLGVAVFTSYFLLIVFLFIEVGLDIKTFLVNGILPGIISSVLVGSYFMIREKENQYRRDFNEEKHNLSRYLGVIRIEMIIIRGGN